MRHNSAVCYSLWSLDMGMVQHRHMLTQKNLENIRRAHSADWAMKGYISQQIHSHTTCGHKVEIDAYISHVASSHITFTTCHLL